MEAAEQRAADADLLARYAKGEPEAARLLTRRLGPLVYGHALRLLGDPAEAEEVTQEAMARLWKMAPDWDAARGAQARTWLYRVTANLCTDVRRRRARAVPLDAVAEPVDPGAGAAGALQARARLAALQAALMTLPERQRQAVVLRHLEGLSNPEIAAVMEIGVAAVESLTARGKRALEAALAGRREALGFDDDTT